MTVDNEPHNLVTRAANAGMQAVIEYLKENGGRADKVIVLVTLDDPLRIEQDDSATAAHGVEDAKELIALLAGHFAGAAKQLGFDVQVFPIMQRGQG